MYDVHKTHVCRKLRALCGFRPVEQVKTCRQQWKKVPDISFTQKSSVMIHHPYHNNLPNRQHFIIINITTTTHHHHHHHWMYCSCSCFPASRCPRDPSGCLWILHHRCVYCGIDLHSMTSAMPWCNVVLWCNMWATQKNTNRILSIESWLFNRGPYNGYLTIPR